MTALDLEPNVDAISNITRTFLAVHRKDRSGGGRPLELVSTLGGAASVAEDESCTAIFAGGFFDRDELVRRFAGGQSSLEDAELLLRIYRASGEDVVAQIRGFFAVVIWDERRNVLLFARDQLGHHSLFFGHASDGLYLSDSIGTLAAEPEVSTEIDRTAVADILMHRQRNPDETCFADVSRARAGWLYRVDAGGISASRYWFPSDPDRDVQWITKDEVGRFDELMERAVARSLAFGPSSIFLSGGLDSVSVAAVAADHAKTAGLPAPLALSLAFPDPQYDETAIQTLVAERLGLPQTLIPFTQAEGSDRLLMTGLRAARVWPTPLVNVWQPLYTYLALAGREQGACTMMTGAGGDEWLSTSPSWAAYGLRRLDIGLVYHLWRTYLTSYDVKPLPMLKNLVWRYGLKEMSRKVAVKAVSRAAPRRTSAVKRRRFLEAKPAWLAPEPGLARMLEEQAESLAPPGDPRVRFVGEALPLFEHPLQAMEREEVFERGRRLGMETFMPFWDVDLVEFLSRVPPRLRNEDHLSKSLVRKTLARRFPEAGFDRQKKILAVGLSTRRVFDEAPDAWRALGGPTSLAELGIVESARLESRAKEILDLAGDGRTARGEAALARSVETYQLWKVLNIESWVRQWV
jgi:asparagine synthetase B (glutamine-hydrolysing)